MIRYDIIEYVFLGSSIGGAIVLLDRFVGGAPIHIQLGGLLITGMLLAAVQFLFIIWRHMRGHPPRPALKTPARPRGQLPAQRNLFLHELNRSWMGLEERPAAERQSSAEGKPHDQDP